MPDQPAPEPLGARALQGLDAAGVRYCVWKGTGHLASSLQGEGDLDLLVHADDLSTARQVLTAAGLVRTPRVEPADQPGAEDWFAVEAGRFVHLQLYTELYVGDLLTGWRRLPPGDGVLDARRRSPVGAWVAPPDAEAVVLLLRAAATPPAGSVRGRLTRARSHGRWREEWRSLLRLTTLDEVAARAAAWLGPEVERAVRAAAEDLAPSAVRELARSVPRLTAPAGAAVAARWSRTAQLAANRADRRALRSGRVVRRALPGGGLHVHVSGRGAAASADDLAAAAATKFDVLRLRAGTRRGDSARRRGLLVVSSGPRPHGADLELDTGQDSVETMLGAVWDRVRSGQPRA